MESQCQECGTEITWGMERVTRNRFHKALCLDCQEEHIRTKYPPKLRDVALKELSKYRSHGFGR